MQKSVQHTIGEEDVEQVYTRSFRVNGYAKMSSEYFIVIINLESDLKKKDDTILAVGAQNEKQTSKTELLCIRKVKFACLVFCFGPKWPR